MSDANWHAALAAGDDVTVWPMRGAQAEGPATTHPLEALLTLSGPVIAAGLDVPPRPTPAKPELDITYSSAWPNVSVLVPLAQTAPAGRTGGAETAIAGMLHTDPDFDGVLLILGAQTCWAHLSAGEVVSFQTFLTPELCAALGAASVPTDAAFFAALTDTLSRPERVAQHLSSARASGSGQIRAHLIGAEIAAAKPYWLGQTVRILGTPSDSPAYDAALRHQGVEVSTGNLEEAYLAGFADAYSRLMARGASPAH